LPDGPDLDALLRGLTALPAFAGVAREQLALMPTTGLAHDHVTVEGLRLEGRAVLLRVPRQSQFAFNAADNLAYQAACFERVAASACGPRLFGVLAPDAGLPMGALAVEQIDGRPPHLPDDLPALAEAMARVHSLPLPPERARAPLADHRDPVAGALAEIEAQAAFLAEADLAAESARAIAEELAWARAYAIEVAGSGATQPRALVLTDTHPGNFLIDRNGHAIIVDLEKALYGAPGIDLAHASVYSSTTWDVATSAELEIADVAAFYARYLQVAAELCGAAWAARLRPWLLPLRRLLFLRAITWCVKWQLLHARARTADKAEAESTEDWSAENSDPALIAHVAGRVALYLSPEVLARMRSEWLTPGALTEVLSEQ